MSISCFAPGRVELLGNHTDYNSGVVLSAALDLGITATGSPSGQIHLSSESLPDVVEVPVHSVRPTGSWSDYPLGVFQILRGEGFPVSGFTAHFRSTLPAGAGLSSSAAIEVATAMLLCKLFAISLEPLALAKLCRRAENEFVGVNCGLLDQASSVFGKAGHAVFLDCRAETVDNIPLPPGCGLLIINSGVQHALTGGEYNERREMCFEAAKQLGIPALRDATSKQLMEADLPATIRHRALHITGENERVFSAIEALRSENTEKFGELMTASHESSMRNFENSTAELDELVRLANEQEGIFGARLTGGGFGGAIVAIGAESALEPAANAITREYHSATGHKATPIICQPGDGAWALSQKPINP
ncbi:MAG: galactokinase [Terrimicrobiaceae bacterium]